MRKGRGAITQIEGISIGVPKQAQDANSKECFTFLVL